MAGIPAALTPSSLSDWSDQSDQSDRCIRSCCEHFKMSDTPTPTRIGQYMNARVTVSYGGQAVGFSDTGSLTYMDDVWVEVTKEKGERLLIPIVSIRHIKLIDPPSLAGESGSLLRASDKDRHISKDER